jgi:hypothetical protein
LPIEKQATRLSIGNWQSAIGNHIHASPPLNDASRFAFN